MTDHSDLIAELGQRWEATDAPVAKKINRLLRLAKQAASALSSQSLSLSEARALAEAQQNGNRFANSQWTKCVLRLKEAEEGRLAAHLIDGVNSPLNACCYREQCKALEARALAAEAAARAVLESVPELMTLARCGG